MIYVLIVFVMLAHGEPAQMEPMIFTNEAECDDKLKDVPDALAALNADPSLPKVKYFGAACVPLNRKARIGTEI